MKINTNESMNTIHNKSFDNFIRENTNNLC